MFTVLFQYADRTEEVVPSDGAIKWKPATVGGFLTIDDAEYEIREGDVAYVMNVDGQTVRKYGRRG